MGSIMYNMCAHFTVMYKNFVHSVRVYVYGFYIWAGKESGAKLMPSKNRASQPARWSKLKCVKVRSAKPDYVAMGLGTNVGSAVHRPPGLSCSLLAQSFAEYSRTKRHHGPHLGTQHGTSLRVAQSRHPSYYRLGAAHCDR